MSGVHRSKKSHPLSEFIRVCLIVLLFSRLYKICNTERDAELRRSQLECDEMSR